MKIRIELWKPAENAGFFLLTPNQKIQAEDGLALEATTDVTGNVKFEGVDPAVYKGVVRRAGKPDYAFTKDVNTGVNARMVISVD